MLFFKKSNIKNIGGDIAYYNLNDWWLNKLSEEERILIRKVFNPTSSLNESRAIDEGISNFSSQSKVSFLGLLASWFNRKEYYNLAKKILSEGEQYINVDSDVLDKHFFYLSAFKIHYLNRATDTVSLNLTVEYYKKQINISKKSKEAFLKKYPFFKLPSHTGYKQLAIIYEKQKNYMDALKITKQALLEGWDNASKKRIDRLEKKILSIV